MSLRQFEEWFVPTTWDIRSEKNPEAESLVDDIEMNLAEFSDGVLTRDELWKELTRIARPFVTPKKNMSVPEQVTFTFGGTSRMDFAVLDVGYSSESQNLSHALQ